ncbi:hypothetical protein Tco_1004930 [Tanacetum coccineum]|uniref:Uncharacterized protein n=1 Tax=Tanacetum coccineum TaxID=301880 RepID=A0ABQ5FDQ7_9ASTR
MDIFTKGGLWDYWKMGCDEIDLSDDETSDNNDEIIEVFRINTHIFHLETPICSAFNEFNYLLKIDPDLLTKDIEGFKTYKDYKNDWIYEWNNDIPWVGEKPWSENGVWTSPTPVEHTCKPFNYKTGCSEWPTSSMEKVDDDNELSHEQRKQWNLYTNYDDAYEINHEYNNDEELCEAHNPPSCNLRKYTMIKYSFNDDEEYVAAKEDEYYDLATTRNLLDYGRRMDGDSGTLMKKKLKKSLT